jgi:GNAT superfamily N-acetyltransferase
MIAHNLQSCFLSLYEIGKHDTQNFGEIYIAYGTTQAPDFNLIFDLEKSDKLSAKYQNDLENALSYANGQENPFLFVQPDNQDFDLSEKLLAANFKKVGQATCVSIEHNVPITVSSDETQMVKRVTDLEMLRDWYSVIEEGFNMPAGDSHTVFRRVEDYLFLPQSMYSLFLLYDAQNNPVSASLLYLPEDSYLSAGLYCGATKEHYRKKGAMSLLIKTMVDCAKERGFERSVAQCYDSSLRLTQKLGFKPSGRLNVFSNV